MTRVYRNSQVESQISLFLMAKIIEETIRTIFAIFNVSLSIFRAIDIMLCAISMCIIVYKAICGQLSQQNLTRKVFASIVILIVLPILYYPFNNSFIIENFNSDFLHILIFGSLFFFVGTLNVNYKELCWKLRYSIYISIVYAFLSFFVILTNGYMVVSYNILPWTLLAYCIYKNFNKKLYLLYFLLLFFLSFIGGARGPILIIILFIIIFNLRKGYFKSKKNIITFIILFITVVFLTAFYKDIAILMKNIFPNSRTLQKIIDSTFSDDSSRKNIYDYFLTVIRDNPFRIRGLFYDRYLTYSTFYNTNKLGFWINKNNLYAFSHNIFIELIVDLGLIGWFLSLVLIIYIIKTISYNNFKSNTYQRTIYLIFLFSGVFHLFISSSFLIHYLFWYYLGLSYRKYKLKERSFFEN